MALGCLVVLEILFLDRVLEFKNWFSLQDLVLKSPKKELITPTITCNFRQ